MTKKYYRYYISIKNIFINKKNKKKKQKKKNKKKNNIKT